jgi:hypothetical protein
VFIVIIIIIIIIIIITIITAVILAVCFISPLLLRYMFDIGAVSLIVINIANSVHVIAYMGATEKLLALLESLLGFLK